MIASDILSRAGVILQDTTFTRWTQAELLSWITDVLRIVCIKKPEEFTVAANIQLTANQSKQTLPSQYMRVVDIVRNMGANGSTPGNPITLIQRGVLDNQRRTWPTETGEVRHYMLDERAPTVFYVYKRPESAAYVEGLFVQTPAAITTSGQTIPLPDAYLGVLVDGVIALAYRKEGENANPNLAALAQQSFFAALDSGSQSSVANSPNRHSPHNQNYPIQAKP